MSTQNDQALKRTTCGFAGVIGLPNAGKSTLVNALVGQKVSIVSRKVQTTRMRILAIAMADTKDVESQIVLLDTPGIFKPQSTFDKAMVGAAHEVMDEADILIHLVDVSVREAFQKNKDIIKSLSANMPTLLVLNKIDQTKKEDLLKMAQMFNDEHPYAQTFMVSALNGHGVEDLKKYLATALPEGVFHFDPDQITDMPMRLMAAEITREQIYDQLHKELPYAVFVETEQWENFDNGDVKISQIIYVQRDSQKAIVLGKGGRQIKKLGERSRTELESILECKVHLKLFVKVKERWPESAEFYSAIGLGFPA